MRKSAKGSKKLLYENSDRDCFCKCGKYKGRYTKGRYEGQFFKLCYDCHHTINNVTVDKTLKFHVVTPEERNIFINLNDRYESFNLEKEEHELMIDNQKLHNDREFLKSLGYDKLDVLHEKYIKTIRFNEFVISLFFK
jgi:hypothetical protein